MASKETIDYIAKSNTGQHEQARSGHPEKIVDPSKSNSGLPGGESRGMNGGPKPMGAQGYRELLQQQSIEKPIAIFVSSPYVKDEGLIDWFEQTANKLSFDTRIEAADDRGSTLGFFSPHVRQQVVIISKGDYGPPIPILIDDELNKRVLTQALENARSEFDQKNRLSSIPSPAIFSNPPESTEKPRTPPNDDGLDAHNPLLRKALSKLDRLVGLEPVKDQIRRLVNLADTQKRREAAGIPTRPIPLHMVFTGNPGTGKTAVAECMGELYHAMGLLKSGHVVVVGAGDLLATHVRQTADKTRKKIQEAIGGVLFIDEAYALIKPTGGVDYGDEAVAELLVALEKHKRDLAVIVAGYGPDIRRFLDSNQGLRSRFRRHIHFDDFSPEELLEIYRRSIVAQGYSFDEAFLEGARQYIDDLYRGRDDTFGNAREIETLALLTIEQQAQRKLDNLSGLLLEDLPPRRNAPKPNLDSALEKLNALTGLATVKLEVRKLVAFQRMNERRLQKGRKRQSLSLRFVFSGNPGTGKTMVAKLMGEIYASMGLLQRGHVVTTSRAEQTGMWQGHTADKVKHLIRDARHGILFIDEAYTLVNGPHDSYGQEAVGTLVAELDSETNRDNLAVILAGYTDEMRKFLATNPGLNSRFPTWIEFPDYSAAELVQLFEHMAIEEDIQVGSGVKEACLAIFEEQLRRGRTDFGNARFVRNFLAEAKKNLALRAEDSDSEIFELSIADLPQQAGVR